MRAGTGLLFLAVTVLSGCGPGVTDGEFEIKNGYSFEDSGGDGTSITRATGTGGMGQMVIEPRVDGYVVEGDSIFVARRPAKIVKKGQSYHWELQPGCEYYAIDTLSNEITRVATSPVGRRIRCY